MRVVQQVDEGLWRAFVDDNPRGNIFHTPEMFRVFARTRGYTPTLWATVGANGQLLALLLPVQITIVGGLLRQLTTRAVVYGGALCAPGREGQQALALLLRTYNQEMRGSALFTELRNQADASDLRPVLQDHGFAYEEHLNFLIDLDRPEASVWQEIRSNARRNIQKARRSEVQIEVADAGRLPAAYALLEAVYKRIQVPLPDLSLFRSAFEVLAPLGRFRVLIARAAGEDIGALTLLLYKGVILYWYTGTLREQGAMRANDLLVWETLAWGCHNGFRLFDFGGGGKPGEAYGVRDFKAKFGGQLVSFGRNTRVHTPVKLKLSEAGFQLVRRFL